MRITVVVLCLAAAACTGQSNSPTSPLPGIGQSGSSATAGTALPFGGTFTRRSNAVFVPPVTLRISGTEEGTATHLGRFAATTVANVDTTNNTATGTYVFTAANGDRLFATHVGVEDSFVPPNISNVTLRGTITGGTGRFAGATGTFT